MKRNVWLPLLVLLLILVAAGIIRSRAVPIGIGAEPEIVSFTATPPVAEPGQPVTLAWNVRGTSSVAIDSAPKDHPPATGPEHAGLPASGTMTVQPKTDTVYTLTCETADGPMCTTSVTVRTE